MLLGDVAREEQDVLAIVRCEQLLEPSTVVIVIEVDVRERKHVNPQLSTACHRTALRAATAVSRAVTAVSPDGGCDRSVVLTRTSKRRMMRWPIRAKSFATARRRCSLAGAPPTGRLMAADVHFTRVRPGRPVVLPMRFQLVN